MEFIMEEVDDRHVCLKCYSEIQGLDNYIEHRRTDCRGKSQENQAGDQQPVGPVNDEKCSTGDDVPTEPIADPITLQRETDLPDIPNKSDEVCLQKRKRGRPRKCIDVNNTGSTAAVDSTAVIEEAVVGIRGRYSPRMKLRKFSLRTGNLLVNEEQEDVIAKSDDSMSDNEWIKPRFRRKKPLVKKAASPKAKTKKPKRFLTAEEKAVVASSKVKNRYNCTPCSFSSLNIYSLLSHMKTIKHSERMVDPEANLEAAFQCDTCSMGFHSEKGLTRHKRRHEQQCACSKCGAEFKTRGALNKHQKSNHAETTEKSRAYATAQCPICGKVVTKTHLKTHLRIHTGERPFACDQCEFRCNQNGDLKIHKKRHYGIKDHKCSLCDFVTVRASTLKNHMMLHTKRERTEECPTCLQKFYNKILLRSHIHSKHEALRDHECTFPGCTYKFKFRMELVTHMRRHNNEKPFLCSVCGYTGSTRQALNRHFRQHTGDKPFKCEHPGCSYMGRVSTHLTRHKRLHTGAKPYKCPYCEYRANTHENLRKHIRNTKKHEGLRVYICKFCSEMKTDDYQDLVHHIRLEHSEEYITFDKVSHQTGLLADKEENLPGDATEDDLVKEDPDTVVPSTEEDHSLEMAIPAAGLAQEFEVEVSNTTQVDENAEVTVHTTDDISNPELCKEYILCRVVQNGAQKDDSNDANGSGEAGEGKEELQSIQMVSVEDGDASQAIEMLLRQAVSSGSHDSQDYIIL